MFKAGNEVEVVAKVHTTYGTSIWVDEMDQYVNDGKVYTVMEDTTRHGDTKVLVKGDGEDWLDYWYFPKGSLRAYGDTQSIVPQVKEIPAYIYNGQVFTAKDDLAGTVANDIITRFVNGKINETSIDRIIADFKGLKELCQKLK